MISIDRINLILWESEKLIKTNFNVEQGESLYNRSVIFVNIVWLVHFRKMIFQTHKDSNKIDESLSKVYLKWVFLSIWRLYCRSSFVKVIGQNSTWQKKPTPPPNSLGTNHPINRFKLISWELMETPAIPTEFTLNMDHMIWSFLTFTFIKHHKCQMVTFCSNEGF